MQRDPWRPTGWDDAFGASPTFLACLRALEVRAEGDAPVLLHGPGGAGKAHLARLLARRGPRARGPLVVVDAARLAPRRLEVVLFGHVHGSTILSAFERAAGGALLLRRVELLPLELQEELLRILVARTIPRPGRPGEVGLDARLLFTARTTDGLAPDLDRRLEPVRLRVPSLAERSGDAAELAARFVARALRARGLRSRALTLSGVGRGLFERASWAGGVAQLEEVVEELVARRTRALRADQAVELQLGPAPPAEAELDDGPAPVDLAAIRALALAC